MKKKNNDDNIIRTSFIETNDKLIEECYSTENGVCYAIWDGKEVKYATDFIEDGQEFNPIFSEEVVNRAIHLPSKAEEYGTDEELDKEIMDFISKWLDIPDDFKTFALWNIKRSWVYERFHTLNYLRALGDTGMGKSRFLDTLGALHYKSISTSGATTSAPIFRIIKKWKGTVLMDESDFTKTDETQDIIKIINMGYEKGKFVMRCDQNDNNIINFFDPYCPKILATRKTFEDKAVESRCITHIMTGTTNTKIPTNLNDDFFDGALKIRNKLLMWRFRNYWDIDPEVKVDLGTELESRVKQIVNSFVSMFCNDEKQLDKFKVFIKNYQEDLIDERRTSFYGEVVGAIHELLKEGYIKINAQDVIDKGSLVGWDNKPAKPRGLTSVLKALGFHKTKIAKVDGKTKRIIPLNEEHLTNLFKRYGYEVTVVTVICGIPQIENQGKVTERGGLPIYRNNRNSVTQEKQQKIEEIDLTPQNSQEFETNLIEFRKCSQPDCENYETNPDSEGNPFCKDHWTGYAKK